MDKLAWQFIGLCYLIFMVYWAFAAFSVKRVVEKQAWRERVWLFLVTFVALLLIGGARGHLGGFSRTILWRPTATLDVLCCLIVLAGLMILLWARTVLGGNWSGMVVFRENHELIERGPYGYVRHPIYSGVFLMVLGTAILSGRVSGFLAFLILVAGFWVKSRQEEKMMTKHFPETYKNYRKRVKALIPFVF
jgi:protein-S-isoprenylcysteine O-methyltransferase Ste14